MAEPSTVAEREWDVIILGAGLSGLTAAYHLLQTDPQTNILILEAKDRVGGRTLSVPMSVANGTDHFDLGGQWVCRTQHHVLWLLNELGIEQYPQFCAGKKIQQSGAGKGKPKVSYYEGDIPSLPPHVLLDLLYMERKGDSSSKQVPYDAPWAAPMADELDSMTFEDFLSKQTWTKGARDVTNTAYEIVLGSRARGYSALFYMFYVSSAISNKSLYDNKNGGAQESKIKGGVQNLSQKIAERIGDDKIQLSQPAVVIDQSPETGRVMVQTLSGETYSSKYLINSIPLNCEAGLQYRPDPPIKRHVLLGHTKIGHLMKFIATYKTTFWRDQGFSGEILNLCSHTPTTHDYPGPLLYVMDSTTADNNPALVGFINHSVHWSEENSEKRREAVLDHLASLIGPDAKEPMDYQDKDWAREPYNGGCPVNMIMPGAVPYWDSIREPFHRVHYAGTETATQWMGYLSGAVQAGLRAADEVTARLKALHADTQSDLLKSLDAKGTADRGVSLAGV